MSFSFQNLSLANVQAQSAVSVLKPGRHVVRVKDAEITETKAKNGYVLVLKLVGENGVITDRLNVKNASKQAEEIGLAQLKGMLECAGHPDPNNPGGVEKIKGLKVGVVVGEDGMYNGLPQVRVKGYCKVEDVASGPSSSAPAGPSIGANDDDIPF